MRNIGATHPVSEIASPPIHPAETQGAEAALCPAHGSQLTELNVEGRVYWCPIGGMFWRASPGHGMHRPLVWPKGM